MSGVCCVCVCLYVSECKSVCVCVYECVCVCIYSLSLGCGLHTPACCGFIRMPVASVPRPQALQPSTPLLRQPTTINIPFLLFPSVESLISLFLSTLISPLTSLLSSLFSPNPSPSRSQAQAYLTINCSVSIVFSPSFLPFSLPTTYGGLYSKILTSQSGITLLVSLSVRVRLLELVQHQSERPALPLALRRLRRFVTARRLVQSYLWPRPSRDVTTCLSLSLHLMRSARMKPRK